ncbi:DEAD/DEAH box helicase family protein [Clostridium estertheticum]|uniref:DEAD/DEAH box helicase family protein n=1 Tax=Clostridium estertheticum TaxID=238834 RepID=UPI001C7DF5FD|nr:DEAD/DEAH box helicase family protein [Clostridium estertheticum]MBX4271310.1 DEAD/DEAH box helicase family protein [Clostridium estertheticum]WLC78277.1 DEAD/DEAH box helicase family protein [Clostridium estertheticum]
MLIDFDRINIKDIEDIPMSPRDIFMSLPNRDKKYDYPRDVQTDVWNQWFERRDNSKDVIIKMNTGSGKTVVGLLILKSSLQEKKGPAVYVVPDPYLVKQVINEANKLGISVTEDEKDTDFLRGKSILVINIHKLINGRSVFGMRSSGNVIFQSIIIDDVHACLNTTEEQFTIKIQKDDIKYSEIFKIFMDDLKNQSINKYLDIFNDVSHANMLVPFSAWQNKLQEVNNILYDHKDDEDISFKFPLLRESLKLCSCIISTEQIEISPKSIPINMIASFQNAKRRIFMSATLADDSPFISHFNIELSTSESIICPKNADDLGDRLIIVPAEINSQIEDDEIKAKLSDLSKKHNTIVIVPSSYRAQYWNNVADIIVDATNIYQAVEKLNKEHVGLVVFINKYDGIDLPDAACRILVIDGLAEIKSGTDKIEQAMTFNSERIQNNLVQKIEQGMGRGVRSNQDYCVVLLLGKTLASMLYTDNAIEKFSVATRKQLELSQQICSQLKGKSLDEIIKVFDYSLGRDEQWVEKSKKVLLNLTYDRKLNVNPITLAYRKAFDMAEIGAYKDAIKTMEEISNQVDQESTKGWLMQQLAEYVNLINPIEAQQILRAAIKHNVRVIKPIEGIEYDKRLKKFTGVGNQLVNFINENNLDENKYILRLNSILENIVFKEDAAPQFEEAFKQLAFYLGFCASRPENDIGKGPDVLWQINDTEFLVIECKNGVTNETICKHDCNQLNGSALWFENYYNFVSASYTPIMIHLGNGFEYACSPDSNIRIINMDKLNLLKETVRKFSLALVDNGNFRNAEVINKLLVEFKLDYLGFLNEFTVGHKVKNTISMVKQLTN